MVRYNLILMLSLLACRLAFAGDYETYITVAADGSGDYVHIQDAIDATKAFPDESITIFIKDGIYHEKVEVYSWNTKLTLEGESKEGTVISYDDYFKKINNGRNATFHTYTLKVSANDCTVKNLTIENTAGRVGQAVALHVEGDRVLIENCAIKGNQDTLYLAGEGRRTALKDCYVEGTVDFIFGEGTAWFEGCEIKALNNSYITAASTPEGVAYGFVFYDCKLTAGDDTNSVYLGRPWRSFAKTVFVKCDMGAHIRKEGWHDWNKEAAHETIFYAELACTGPGAAADDRAEWSRVLKGSELKRYTKDKVLGDWCF